MYYYIKQSSLISWFCPCLVFSTYLQNVFYNWFVQIRIQIRFMCCIWLIMSVSHWYQYHPYFWHGFICWRYWIFFLEFLLFWICLFAFSWCWLTYFSIPCNFLDLAVWLLLSGALPPSASREEACDLLAFWWCQDWSVSLAIGSLVH